MTADAPAKRRLTWFTVAIAASTLVVVIRFASGFAGAEGRRATGEGWSLAFGLVAAVLGFSQVLYPLRRALMARPFGTAKQALQFHTYSSLVMFVCVLSHIELRVPVGWLGRSLLALSAWTTISGLAALAAQKTMPRQLMRLSEQPGAEKTLARAELMLRAWPILHVPTALALLALLAWHIFGVLYF